MKQNIRNDAETSTWIWVDLIQAYNIDEAILNLMVNVWLEGSVLVGRFSTWINMQEKICVEFWRVSQNMTCRTEMSYGTTCRKHINK